jgi:hypothetical protein
LTVSSDLLLPEGSRLIHIGPHKTGSTAIQVAMHESRDALAAHGVMYPKGGYRPRKAGWALGLPSRPAGVPVPPIEHWTALVEAVRDTELPRVCVSNESFGRAEDEQVARIVQDLGGADVHVVAVARPLAGLFPSLWQERVKAGLTTDYAGWLESVLGEETDTYHYRNLWHAHDVEALVQRWLQHVPPERFTLVVMDESDRAQLSRIFEDLLGLPDGLLASRPGRANESLALAEVELIRAANELLHDRGLPRAQTAHYVRRAVAAIREYDGPRPGPRKPPMPQWAATRLEEITDAAADAVAKLPVRVIGDPDWLRSGSIEPGDVDPEAMAVTSELGGTLLAGLVSAALEATESAKAEPAAEPTRRARPRRGPRLRR